MSVLSKSCFFFFQYKRFFTVKKLVFPTHHLPRSAFCLDFKRFSCSENTTNLKLKGFCSDKKVVFAFGLFYGRFMHLKPA